MLSQNPGETTPEDSVMTQAHTTETDYPPAAQQQEAVQELMEAFQASPEFKFDDAFSEYLTSPFDDSPLDELLTTPALPSGDLGADIYNSPVVGDDWGLGAYQGSLFHDMTLFQEVTSAPPKQSSAATSTAAPSTISPANIDLNNMWSISPATPALEHSPLSLPVKPLPATRPSAARQRVSATGTRKNITPETLVPIDAPTQPRKYVTPSATSRKDVPAVFARKRARAMAFEGETDELEEEALVLPPNPTEQDLIEAKRRQNTIAARRSRKRKLEYQRNLEDQVEALKEERDEWRAKAQTYQALLKSHGIDAPEL